jgi:uncharacterized membrane protein
MTMRVFYAAAAGLLVLGGPVMAQPAGAGAGAGAGMERGRSNAFAGMSEAGQATMRAAMRDGFEERRDERAKIRAARDKMLAVVEADRLDTAALKRAMDEEREIAAASHVLRQDAMLAGLSKLSVEDRKAFVAGARTSRERVAERVGRMRERRMRR